MHRKIVFAASLAFMMSVLAALPALAGNPSFDFNYVYYDFPGCTGISTADINSDGRMDVIAANNSVVSVYRQKSDGSFEWLANVGNIAAASILYADDIEEDGDLDIMALSTFNNQFVWFRQGGGSSWTRYDLTNDFKSATAMSPVGYDWHGDNHIIVAAQSPKNKMFEVAPLPDLNAPGYAFDVAPLAYVSALAVEDMDQDGDMDLVVGRKQSTSYGSGAAIVYFDWDPGTGWAQTSVPTGAFFNYVTWLGAGDIDRDGDADVVVNSSIDGLNWIEDPGSAGGNWPTHLITKSEFYHLGSLNLADMDNDGDLDVTASTINDLIWWENGGEPDQTGNWIRHVVAYDTSSQANGFLAFPADINADGQTDLVACDRWGGGTGTPSLVWYENETDLPSGDQLQFWQGAVDNNLGGAWGVDVADFNSDGWLDVAATGYTSNKVRWYATDPDPELTFAQTFETSATATRGLTVDSPGHSRAHFLVAGKYSSGEVREYQGANSGWTQTTNTRRLANLGSTEMVALGDVSGDGLPDVIGTSIAGDKIVYAQSSYTTSTWPLVTIDSSCDQARSVAACDLDGDGDIDVAGACQGTSKIRWWENQDEVWTRHTVPVGFAGATDVACADMNNDGENEIVAASPGLWSITWFQTDAVIGDGKTMGWVTDTFTDVRNIHLVDVDRDGDMDVVAGAAKRDQLVWFENPRTTNYFKYFTPHTIDDVLNAPREISSGDIVGNGAIDLAAAAQNDNAVYWYQQGVGSEVYVDKMVDLSKGGSFEISTGESIPYLIQVTNAGPNDASFLVVDRWQPANAVVDASGEGCVAVVSSGVMTCTMPTLKAGRITDLSVVITPSLTFKGFIDNSVKIVPEGLFYNTGGDDTAAALPVEVHLNKDLTDLGILPGFFPSAPIQPGTAFTYTMIVNNLGPMQWAGGILTSQWLPAGAVEDHAVIGIGQYLGGSSRDAQAAVGASAYDPETGELEYEFDVVQQGAPIEITLVVTTSQEFDDILENRVSVDTDAEGNPANNQSIPIRIGAYEGGSGDIYLPVLFRADE